MIVIMGSKAKTRLQTVSKVLKAKNGGDLFQFARYNQSNGFSRRFLDYPTAPKIPNIIATTIHTAPVSHIMIRLRRVFPTNGSDSQKIPHRARSVAAKSIGTKRRSSYPARKYHSGRTRVSASTHPKYPPVAGPYMYQISVESQ